MVNVCIDIETLATTPDAVILSIGAVAFSTKDNSVDVENAYYSGAILPVQMARRVCPDTQKWWSTQNIEAYRAAFNGTVPLDTALKDLVKWGEKYNNCYWWGNSPSFDMVILEDALRSYGMRIPWKFWNTRDLRTIKYLASRAGGKDYPKPPQGEAHNALSDAINQAEAINYYHEVLLK